MKDKLNLADINVKVGIGYALILIILLLLYIAFTKWAIFLTERVVFIGNVKYIGGRIVAIPKDFTPPSP